MKNALITLLLSSLIMSFSVNAETVTGYGYSIDSAENMIKEKQKKKDLQIIKLPQHVWVITPP